MVSMCIEHFSLNPICNHEGYTGFSTVERREVIDIMKRTIAFALPLLFVSLMIIQANAVLVPVEVERIKDFYFCRVRGDYTTQSFLLHYVNLSPAQQVVGVFRVLWAADGSQAAMFPLILYTLAPGESIDLDTYSYGLEHLNLRIWIDNQSPLPPVVDEWVKLPSSP